jgi:tetratricopeptide (TPR) repeat protein
MRRLWHHSWIFAALGIAVGAAHTWAMTPPSMALLASAPPARSGEPNAALIDDYLTHIHAALAAYRTQRFEEATRAFEAAAALRPSESLAYRYLAELHWQAGKPEQAQQAIDAFAAIVGDAYALDQVGRFYEEAGLTGLAIRIYRTAVGLDPKFPGAHYNLGRLHLEAADLERGIAEMQAALRLHPDFPEAHQALGIAYAEQQRFDDAIVHLQRALVLAPDLTMIRNHLGRIFLAQGRLEQAVETFKVLVERNPDIAEARHNLAVACARQGQQELAIEQFSQALRLRPRFHAARLDLVALLLEMGRLPDALETARAGLAGTDAATGEPLSPELIELRYRLGLAYRLGGQRPQAIQELQTVLRTDPTHAGAHANLSYLYYQTEDFNRAWRHARQAESLGLPVPDILAVLRRVSAEPP